MCVNDDYRYTAGRASSDLSSNENVSGTHEPYCEFGRSGKRTMFFPAMFICQVSGFDVNLNSWVSSVHASLLLGYSCLILKGLIWLASYPFVMCFSALLALPLRLPLFKYLSADGSIVLYHEKQMSSELMIPCLTEHLYWSIFIRK